MDFLYTFNPFSVYNKVVKAVYIYLLVCEMKKGRLFILRQPLINLYGIESSASAIMTVLKTDMIELKTADSNFLKNYSRTTQ